MMTLRNCVPSHHDTVIVAGREGSFFVIGIDSVNETVEVRTASAPFVVIKNVPWANLAFTQP
jgi:hypothetical protein